MVPPGLRATKKEQARRTIATTALTLFLERGFEEVSVAEIAQAAGVSKMTVFNYFPAKEDLFFEFVLPTMPDLAGAVRKRQDGEAPVTAIRRFLHAELERRAEWTGLHDGVSKYSRLIFRSPTLISGFDRLWRERERELTEAFAEAVGVTPDPHGESGPLAETLTRPGRGSAPERAATIPPTAAQPAGRPSAPSSETVILRVVVGQVLAAIQTLILVNQYRQSAGLTADQTATMSLAECESAFDLLEGGLAGYGKANHPRRA
jgi:AcrR family transcriptional regulator